MPYPRLKQKQVAVALAALPFTISFALDVDPLRSSYPRKRISSSSAADWIPASVGMTETY
jgi:hypothetical protein